MSLIDDIDPVAAQQLVNLSRNIRGLLVLGLEEMDPSDWRLQQARQVVTAVVTALEIADTRLKRKHGAAVREPGAPPKRKSYDEATAARWSRIAADLEGERDQPVVKRDVPIFSDKPRDGVPAQLERVRYDPKTNAIYADVLLPARTGLPPADLKQFMRRAMDRSLPTYKIPCEWGSHYFPANAPDRCKHCMWPQDTLRKREELKRDRGGLRVKITSLQGLTRRVLSGP